MLLVQYESLTSPDRMSGELTGLKSFLGIDPALPSSQLPLTNYKHVHTGHGPDAVRAPACLGRVSAAVHCGLPLRATLAVAPAPDGVRAHSGGVAARHGCCALNPPLQLGRYWVMKRWELEHLVDIARNNTME